jgi:hypothetical protein
MTDKDHQARRSIKKVRLQKATASEIISSLRITPLEARRAKAAVKFVMREAEKAEQSSRKTSSKSRAAAKVV